jgi:hypothetical protein
MRHVFWIEVEGERLVIEAGKLGDIIFALGIPVLHQPHDAWGYISQARILTVYSKAGED